MDVRSHSPLPLQATGTCSADFEQLRTNNGRVCSGLTSSSAVAIVALTLFPQLQHKFTIAMLTITLGCLGILYPEKNSRERSI